MTVAKMLAILMFDPLQARRNADFMHRCSTCGQERTHGVDLFREDLHCVGLSGVPAA